MLFKSGILSCDIPVVLDIIRKAGSGVNTQLVRWWNATFIAETTSFGLCTGPSSGLAVYQKENYAL